MLPADSREEKVGNSSNTNFSICNLLFEGTTFAKSFKKVLV